MFADGMTAKAIAAQIGCGEQEVKNEMQRVAKRIGVHRMPAIIAECMRRGWIK